MLDIVLEKPWFVGIAGAFITLGLLQWWIRSGLRNALLASLFALVLTLVLVGISLSVETERESLHKMIYQTAEDLEKNRVNEINAAIYSTPSSTVLAAKEYMNNGNYVFDAARIKKIHELEFSGPTSARRAIVKMNVFVEGRFDGYSVKVPQYVEVTLYRVGDEWKVYDFLRDQPFAGFQMDQP